MLRRAKPVEDECGHQNCRSADRSSGDGVREVVDAQADERNGDGARGQVHGQCEQQARRSTHPPAGTGQPAAPRRRQHFSP
jgi:hypothetical protein